MVNNFSNESIEKIITNAIIAVYEIMRYYVNFNPLFQQKRIVSIFYVILIILSLCHKVN